MLDERRTAERERSDAFPRRSGVRLRDLATDTRGAGMVEYIIILGVVALAAQTAFRAFGASISNKVRQQADTVSQLDSDCVGGLCVVRVDLDNPTSPTPSHT